MQFSKIYFQILLLLLLLVACSRNATLGLFDKATPYEKYKRSLKDAALDQTALGKEWLKAGEVSLHDSLIVELPYQESGYFPPENPTALCLRYPVLEGQSVHVTLEALAQPDIIFFIDVFEVNADSSLQQIHAADSTGNLSYEVEESGWHAVRIQPELLRGGPYLLSIGFQPTLSFPVSGKNSRAVGSFFGDPRDGGKRSHKGVDIFAPKGTPVLAASDGVVGRVTTNRLGGKVVWLTSLKKRFTQYYAHLDSQAVKPGQSVHIGDTLGFVGNTGNARFTPPHLHFSIYKLRAGAVDPFPFIHQLLEEAPDTPFDSTTIGIPARVKTTLANVRPSPTTQSDIRGSFPRHTLLSVEGKSGRWFRIALPNTKKGYIHESLIESIEHPVHQVMLTAEDYFYTTPSATSNALSGALASGSADVLATFDSLLYIKTPKGYYGWVPEEKLQQIN